MCPRSTRTTPHETRLTARQARFVGEYMVDLNATRAAITAGYARRSAQVTAHRLLRRRSVQAAVADGKALQLEKAGISAQRVLEA
ncbi:MAG: terminase small subunit, partial [Gemmatimonadaceae bacterium]